jgi:hypothetical protein
MTPEPVAPAPVSPKNRLRGRILAMLAVVAAAIALAFVYAQSDGHRGGAVVPPARPPSPTDPDSKFRQIVIGTWTDNYQGKRTMNLKADGTGTMVVELSGWKATLSASRLQFDMVWSVEGGHLKKRTVGGEPAAQVQMIRKTMGDKVDEPILELTEERLLLLDQDGKTKYDWQKVKQ